MATNPTTTKPHVPAAKFAADIKGGTTVKAMTAAEAKAAKGEPFMVPLDNIRVYDDFNVRVTGTPASEEAMAELVQSIVANGFYNHKPLAVFVAADGDSNVLYIKDGHRRFEAVQRANAQIEAANAVEGAEQRDLIAALPVIASPAGSLEDMMIEMAQSNTGAPLTMFEKGLLAKRLLDADMTKDDIAARLSMTERHLNNVLLLASAPAKLRDLIVTDKVTPTTGLKLMRDPKTAAQKATEMVKASEAKGKTKAQPKDSSGPKMKATTHDFTFGQGDSIKTVLQNLAAKVRELIAHGEDDAIGVDAGKIVLTISVPAPAPEPKPAPAPKAAAKPAKAPAKAKGGAKAPASEKAADTAPAGTDQAPEAAAAATTGDEDLSGL